MVTFAALCMLCLSGCAARYILSDGELNKARQKDAVDRIRVYVSHRTIPVYERKEMEQTLIRREIQDRSQKERDRRPISRNLTGGIVGQDVLNGQPRLWVSFSRSCSSVECAYGFVRTEGGRYHLVNLPVRDEFDPPNVYRSCRIKRHKMEHGKLKALSDANAVYKLKRRRKKRPKTVFLEVKKSADRRVKDTVNPEDGFD